MPSPSECALKETEEGGRHSWKNPTNWRKKKEEEKKKTGSYGTRCEKDGWLFISLVFSDIFFFSFLSSNILSLFFAISSSFTPFSCSIYHHPSLSVCRLFTPLHLFIFCLYLRLSSPLHLFFLNFFFSYLPFILFHPLLFLALLRSLLLLLSLLLLVKRQPRPKLTDSLEK